jgi:hypothetical protein
MLVYRLKPVILSRNQELLIGVVLLHDNTCPHTAIYIAETLWKLKSDIMVHHPNSPDLIPSSLVWPTQRGTEEWLILLRPRNEGIGASMAQCSAENILFYGHKEACAMMYQVHSEARGLC